MGMRHFSYPLFIIGRDDGGNDEAFEEERYIPLIYDAFIYIYVIYC